MENLSKHLNTILLSVISLILVYGVNTINNQTKDINNLRVEVAVLNNQILSHNESASIWIDQIKDNANRIHNLEEGNVAATADRITKSEVLAAIDGLRVWVNKNYEPRDDD